MNGLRHRQQKMAEEKVRVGIGTVTAETNPLRENGGMAIRFDISIAMARWPGLAWPGFASAMEETTN